MVLYNWLPHLLCKSLLRLFFCIFCVLSFLLEVLQALGGKSYSYIYFIFYHVYLSVSCIKITITVSSD